MAKKVWHLLCYDITQPKRLQKVHRFMKKQGLVAQESVFFVYAKENHMQALLAELARMIDTKQDDIRTYPIAHPSQVWMAGQQTKTQLLLDQPITEKQKPWQKIKSWIMPSIKKPHSNI